MNQENIFDEIKKYFISEFEVESNKIVPEALLFDELGLDSLDALNMVSMLESEHGIELDDSALFTIRTIGDVVTCIEKAIEKK
ncbi:MAG: acyl carrier protein [Spirochaetes bacterium]|jgi:acyl carrier protein|nr:acyl carrier protein [Spirochaetota bacterium]